MMRLAVASFRRARWALAGVSGFGEEEDKPSPASRIPKWGSAERVPEDEVSRGSVWLHGRWPGDSVRVREHPEEPGNHLGPWVSVPVPRDCWGPDSHYVQEPCPPSPRGVVGTSVTRPRESGKVPEGTAPDSRRGERTVPDADDMVMVLWGWATFSASPFRSSAWPASDQ